MKSLIQAFVLSLFFSTANATLIEANYTFNGTEFTLESGQDVFNMDYQEGDTLRLTIYRQTVKALTGTLVDIEPVALMALI